jgi:tripartite-type tricarboxylate transporter receptor subunit TctC
MDAAGVPGYEAASIYGLWFPSGTPQAIINRWNREVVRVFNDPGMKERLLNGGIEARSSSPAEFAKIIASEIAKWSKVIRDAGLHD